MDKSHISIGEAMSNVDPVEAVEKMLGKSWQDFSDEDQLKALMLIGSFNMTKHEILQSIGDTHFGCKVREAEYILQNAGFQIGFRDTRISASKYKETETIWCRPDGLLVYIDTYTGSSCNHFDLYGEIRRKEDPEEFQEQYSKVARIVQGGGSYGLFPNDYDTPIEKKNISFEADVRSGLRWKLKLIAECGELIPVWEDVGKHSWFVNHDEEKVYDSISGGCRGIFKRKVLGGGTPMLRAIAANFIKEEDKP